MDKLYPEKRIFITGAGSGLGLAIALKFGHHGWRVAVTDVDGDRASAALVQVRAAGGDGFAAACDVRSDDALRQVQARVIDDWSGVDIVINNAGVAGAGTVAETPQSDWEWMLDINLMGVVRGCRVFAPLLVAQGSGHIVNIASFAGIAQAPGMASYNVAKVGVIGLSETLRSELHDSGVGVSVACPSFFQTNLMESFRSSDRRMLDIASKLMFRATVTADDVAGDIYQAIMRNRFMIITHADARWLYRIKRYAPNLFFRLLARQSRSFAGPVDRENSRS